MEHQITIIKLSGLSCGACKKIIERRLQKRPEVMSVNVSLEDSTATIVAMRAVTADEVAEALRDTEYTVIGMIEREKTL